VLVSAQYMNWQPWGNGQSSQLVANMYVPVLTKALRCVATSPQLLWTGWGKGDRMREIGMATPGSTMNEM
jgi:hypothetical protein